MKALSTIVILSLLMTGCSKELVDFVSAGGSRVIDDLSPPSLSSSSPYGVKISPGANIASGSAVQARFAITTSRKPLQGSQVKGTISFHQNRPQ